MFNRLTAISYAFVDSSAADVQERLRYLQRLWRDTIQCEELLEDWVEARNRADLGREEARADLVQKWCPQFIRKTRDILIPFLSESERLLVALGTQVDQGVRRSEIYRFMSTTEHSEPWQFADYKPHQGEFEPDASWRSQIVALAAKLELEIDDFIPEERQSTVEVAGSMDASIQMRLKRSQSDPLAKDEAEVDGPCPTFTWRHNGEVVLGQMRSGSWKLVKHLWGQDNRTAHRDAISELIYGAPAKICDASEIGSRRRDANKFFRTHEIPWKVAIAGEFVHLSPAQW